ncbi:AAA family ATPase [Rufibacter sp. XAAS-G3-1]|uniref:AAA family ATPase n=1 Tax=Rufibacter sp. XAAS-G3-1 TaxID=2729134 RepID=UPI0015E79956|nr:AAA family ATPase [Rufibacter sp. XAAS-G3-1]
MVSNAYLQELRFRQDSETNPNKYPFDLPAFNNFDGIRFGDEVTYLVGENGMGKSTVLEAIALSCGFNPEGGTKNFSFSTRASHSDLYKYIHLSKGYKQPKDGFFLRSESFYNLATQIEELDKGGGGKPIIDSYGGRSLHEQSHGESFWALFMNRFSGNGIYILDEPEAALSPTRQMAMLVRMKELISNKSQFIIATHSPIVLAYPGAVIYELSSSGFKEVAYKETELYSVTKEFINNTDNMLNILLQ